MATRDGSKSRDKEKFGSGTPGNQGTYSVVGEQPDGGGAGLGAQVESGDGSPQDVAEAGGNPQHRNAPAADSAKQPDL